MSGNNWHPVLALVWANTSRLAPGIFTGLFRSVATLAAIGLAPAVDAASQEWKDPQGNSFKAEASEVLGPLGLFQTGRAGSRLMPWRALAPADCVRFHEQSGRKAARADDWAQAKGAVSVELRGRVHRVEGDKLVEASLAGRPEPQFFVVFYANNSVGKSWDMLGHAIEPFNRLQQAFPGQIEGLFFGMWHKNDEHRAMALQMKLPWLVADYNEEHKLATVAALAPLADHEAFSLIVINRSGVPVFSASSPDTLAIDKVLADLTGVLELMRPGNPRGWPDRAYYLRAVQPVAFAAGHADPVLVGNPLVPEGLRKNHVARVDAIITVAADGSVTGVDLKPDEKTSAKMAAALVDALTKACLFVPAVDHGQFVAGTFHYYLEVTR